MRFSAGGDRTCDSLQVLRPSSNISAHRQRPDLPLFGQSRTRIGSGMWLTFFRSHALRRKSSTDTWCYTMSRQSRHRRTASTAGGASLYWCQEPEDRRHLSDGKSELCTGNEVSNTQARSSQAFLGGRPVRGGGAGLKGASSSSGTPSLKFSRSMAAEIVVAYEDSPTSRRLSGSTSTSSSFEHATHSSSILGVKEARDQSIPRSRNTAMRVPHVLHAPSRVKIGRAHV